MFEIIMPHRYEKSYSTTTKSKRMLYLGDMYKNDYCLSFLTRAILYFDFKILFSSYAQK